MTPLVVALGDSTSCGEGVGLRVPARRTWPALLAAATGGELLPLAVAGSRLRDLRQAQLAAALRSRPDVVTLLIGLNDVGRAGFDPRSFSAELQEVVGALRSTGALVLLGRLHDVTAVLPLPRALRAAVRARTDVVNASVDACTGGRVLPLDLAALPRLRLRAVWDIDRMHPNTAGHAAIAEAAAGLLRAEGLAVERVRQPPVPAVPGPLREGRWLVRHGLPWLAAHVPQVVLPAVSAAARPARPA